MNILVLVAVISSLLLGPGLVWASEYGHAGMANGKYVTGCEKRFQSMDSGNRGYVTYPQFEAAFNADTGGGGGIGSHLGYQQSGNAYSRFAERDTNNNGKLTLREFCG